MTHYDRDDTPIPMSVWAMKLEGGSNVVKQDFIDTDDGEVKVSTIWLGLDHSWGQGPPLIFETMIFGGKYDQYQERWANEVAALAGHDQAVALVRQTAHAR